MLKTMKFEYDGEPEPIVKRGKIFLGDTDISRYVTGIDISMGVDKITQVTLHCVAAIELPELLANIVVEQNQKEE